VKPGLAVGVVALHPAVRALTGDTEFLGHVSDRTALDTDTVNQQPAAVHGQPGITVGHEDLQGVGEVGKLHFAWRPSQYQLPQRRVTNVSIEYN
jgi:hypothetical protein